MTQGYNKSIIVNALKEEAAAVFSWKHDHTIHQVKIGSCYRQVHVVT